MNHRYKHFQSKIAALLCALSLVFACGLKEPLHFLSHDANGTACELTHGENAYSKPVRTTVSEVAPESCFLKSFFDVTAGQAFSLPNAASEPAFHSEAALYTTFALVSPLSFTIAHWHSPRGPPAV